MLICAAIIRSSGWKAGLALLGATLLQWHIPAQVFTVETAPAKDAKTNQAIASQTQGSEAPVTLPFTNAPRQPVIRVMTYNIHHGEGLDGKVDLERIAALIKREGADLVALQEVDRGVARTARRDLPAELAALTGMTAVFSNNFHFQGGEYGNAVLTRFPVKQWTNRHYQMLRLNEQRGLLQLTLDVQGRAVVFLNTHIDYRPDDAERWLNVGEIETVARHHQGKPIILCGDFNDTPGSRIHQKLQETFIDVWQQAGQGEGFTFPVRNPGKRIDFIWLSKDSPWAPVRIWVPHSEASDHLPVVAELQFR